MPMTTYFEPCRQRQPIRHPIITQLIADVRAATGRNWCIREFEEQHSSWFGLRVVTVLQYQLLVELQGIEFQVINFYRDPERTTLNHYVPAELIMAFLFGIMAGVQDARQKEQKRGESSAG